MTQHALIWALPKARLLVGFFLQQQAAAPSRSVVLNLFSAWTVSKRAYLRTQVTHT